MACVNALQVGTTLGFEFIDTEDVKRMLSEYPAKSCLLLFIDNGTDSIIEYLCWSSEMALNALLDSGSSTLV